MRADILFLVQTGGGKRGVGRRLLLLLLIISLMTISARAAVNLLTNPGFETGTTTGWTGRGGSSLAASSAQVHTGSFSGLASNRTQTWEGPMQSLLGVMQNGKSYKISGWVRLQNADSNSIGLTVQQTDSGGTQYHSVEWLTGYDDQWVLLSGGFTLNVNGTLSVLDVYFEGPAAGVNFYLDDAEVVDTSGWKAEADARIEQIRKRDAQITVLNPQGHPLSGVQVQIDQIKHRFAFGSAINHNVSDPNYTQFFKDHFEWAVMENESKWYSNEPSQGQVDYNTADMIYNWCNANGIIMRGHCVYWCVDQYVQSWIKNLSYAPLPATSELRTAVENRMDSAVNHFKGKFVHWDINNEMLHSSFFQDRLGPNIRPWMFQEANSIDPNCLLFVNDYEVVSSGGYTSAYKVQIQDFINTGVPVHGVGAQCHFWGSDIEPYTVYDRLESLAQMGLPIWCTEYDFASTNVNIRADGLEKFYRTAFSHSAVGGILMWGFWEDSHWRGDCHIVDSNWSLNAAGIRYESLMDEWTTNDTNTTDFSGNVNFRGFHGTYEITLTVPGVITEVKTIELEPGATPAEFIFELNLGDHNFDISRSTIDGGGGLSTGGQYVLTATIGQADAAYSYESDYELLGGFWPGEPSCTVGFRLFARFAEYWLETGPDLPADLYADNVVDYLDLGVFVDEWLCYCPYDWPLK